MPTDRIAKMGILISLGLVFSYVEALIPIMPSVPGVKIGLSNALVILLLYSYGIGYCFIFQLCRIIISSILFGNVFGCVYSLAGATLSILVMCLLKKVKWIDVPGNSMLGGISHNLAQLLVAYFLVQNTAIFYYVPILLISGSLSGYIIGWISEFILKRRLL